MKDFIGTLNKSSAELAELISAARQAIEEQGRADYATSFAVQLEVTAKVLRSNGMPQSTVNMALAARCGIPFEPVDTKSMYVQWTEDEPKIAQ